MVGAPMMTWLSRLFRLSNRLLSTTAALLSVVVVALATATYLGATGASVSVVRHIAAHAGAWLVGQHTDHIDLEVHVDPQRAWIDATAALTVRATQAPRSTFFFFLNPGFEVRAASVALEDGTQVPAKTYRLWALTAVELDQPLPLGSLARIEIAYAGRPALDPFGGESASVRADRVLLGPETFWYPYDAQSFFRMRARVSLPARLTLVHNGMAPAHATRGATQEVSWVTERPVAGMALIAGNFAMTNLDDDATTVRVYIPRDVGLDPQRIARSVVQAKRLFTETFGESGYSQLTVVVDREIYRAFNDGSGLMAAAPRYFRDGDYGFHLLAHETAHVWWGGTVSERWLEPGTGGQWLVEGWATLGAALATEERYGDAGLARVRRDNFFDPERQGVVRHMSFLDNVLDIRRSRDTIYRKGGYTALMLREILGRDAFVAGMRRFIDDHRFKQATDADLQAAFETASGADLSEFFADWIGSDSLPDLALESRRDGQLEVQNRGRLPLALPVAIGFVDADGHVTTTTARVGETVPAPVDRGFAVVDPDLVWADVWRENNRYPARRTPVQVTAAAAERILLVSGSDFAWGRTGVSMLDASGAVIQEWEFSRGLAGRPRWAPAGGSAVLAVSRADGGEPNIVSLQADAKRRIVGRGSAPAFAADGSIVAANNGRIVRLTATDKATTLLEREDWHLGNPLPSPTGRFLLYEATHRSRMQLRSRDNDSGDDILLLEGERERITAAWAQDEGAVYAAIGVDAHWRVVRLPLGPASPTTIADGIDSLAGLSLSPGGTQMALLASAGEAYPDPRHVLYVVDLRTQNVTTLDIAGHDARDVTWLDAGELLIVARSVPAAEQPRLPAETSLWRAVPATGALSRFSH